MRYRVQFRAKSDGRWNCTKKAEYGTREAAQEEIDEYTEQNHRVYFFRIVAVQEAVVYTNDPDDVCTQFPGDNNRLED